MSNHSRKSSPHEEKRPYSASAAVYDATYGRIAFAEGAGRVHEIIRARKRVADETLLDVACGTGRYLEFLRDRFAVEGLDLSQEMLSVARERLPEVPLHQGNLVDFDLGRRFGAVVCLGSSIGYAGTVPRLRAAIATIAAHLLPGGVAVIEPWFHPDVWETGRVTMDTGEVEDVKVARMLVSGRRGDVSTLAIHHLVAQGGAVSTFVEHHELGLFTHLEYLDAFNAAGLEPEHDPVGLIGRGLYIGVRRAESHSPV